MSSIARLQVRDLRSDLAGPFDLSLDPGECVTVTGPSGSGKSLMLRMIADLDPNQGTVLLDGRDRATWPAPAWRRQVVYNPAETGWWDEQVAPHFHAALLDAAIALAPVLGLDTALFQGPVIRLSTGERQRMALLRVLVLDPPVMLLDEPTGALDQANTALVETELRRRLDAEAAILMVTHGEEQATRMGRRHLRIANRRLVTP